MADIFKLRLYLQGNVCHRLYLDASGFLIGCNDAVPRDGWLSHISRDILNFYSFFFRVGYDIAMELSFVPGRNSNGKRGIKAADSPLPYRLAESEIGIFILRDNGQPSDLARVRCAKIRNG